MVHGSSYSLRPPRRVFREVLSGQVEADETFIGGKARNMHVAERKRRITGTGGKDKTAVMGILERGGKVRTVVVPNRKKKALQAEVRKHVEAGFRALHRSCFPTTGWKASMRIRSIDHAVEYVDGSVHTNGLENFWSLLKRGINGTYVSSNRSTCSAIWTSRHTATTTVPHRTIDERFRPLQDWPCLRSSASA